MSNLSSTSMCRQVAAVDLAKDVEKSVLLDVRSPIEFEAEHIANSINIPLNELDTRCEEIPRLGQLVVICRSGKRAERGAYTLLGKGFQPVILQGGIMSWRKAGLPIKEGKKMLSIERQIQLIVGSGVLTGVILGILVNRWFLIVPAVFGTGLTLAGLTDTCALGLLLMKAPWNKLPGKSPVGDPGFEKPKNNCSS